MTWRVGIWLGLVACGGAVWTEDTAGGDGFLSGGGPDEEHGTAASDGYCGWIGHLQVSAAPERAYAELQSVDVDCDAYAPGQETRHTLIGWEPSGALLRREVPALGDPRLLFGDDEVVWMGETGDGERLLRLDPGDLRELASTDLPARYWGTRTAPSRRLVAVADSLEEELGVHLIDLSTLGVAELATGGTWAEAQWMADADRLIAAVADVTWVVQSDGRRVVLTTEGTTPRVVMWDLSGVEVPAGAAGDPLVVPPAWEIEVPGTIASTVFSYSWIGVDPLGRYAAVPLERDEGGWTIAVVSAADGALRRVDGVAGPVAFSPDGAFFVGWSQVDQGSQLVVVDVETLERRLIPTPSYAIPSYFMSHEGTEVVVASAFGEAELSIVDASTGETARLGVPLGLWSFSSRLGHDEVWMTGAPADVEGAADQLWRLDLAAGAIEAIPLDWSPGQVVWLPDADLLLLKDHDRPRMVLWDPDAREVTRELDLSLPPGP